jgi:hypothetical protein
MKYLPLLFITLILSCTEETPETLVYQKERPYSSSFFPMMGNVKTVKQKFYRDVISDNYDENERDKFLKLMQKTIPDYDGTEFESETIITYNAKGFVISDEKYEVDKSEDYVPDLVLISKKKYAYKENELISSISYGSDALGDTLKIEDYIYNDYNQIKYVVNSTLYKNKIPEDTVFVYYKLDSLSKQPFYDAVRYNIRGEIGGEIKIMYRNYLSSDGFLIKRQQFNDNMMLVSEYIYDNNGNSIKYSTWDRDGKMDWVSNTVYDSSSRLIKRERLYNGKSRTETVKYNETEIIKKVCDVDYKLADDQGCVEKHTVTEVKYSENGNLLYSNNTFLYFERTKYGEYNSFTLKRGEDTYYKTNIADLSFEEYEYTYH